MSSLNALRLATKAPTSKAPLPKPSTHLYPIFTESEKAMIQTLRDDASSYRVYADKHWFDTLIEGERFVGAMALEGCLDPLEAVCDHWFVAIEHGKMFQERSLYVNKAQMLAYTLNERGLLELNTAYRYLGEAVKSDVAVGISLARIKQIVEEFQIGLNQNTQVTL